MGGEGASPGPRATEAAHVTLQLPTSFTANPAPPTHPSCFFLGLVCVSCVPVSHVSHILFLPTVSPVGVSPSRNRVQCVRAHLLCPPCFAGSGGSTERRAAAAPAEAEAAAGHSHPAASREGATCTRPPSLLAHLHLLPAHISHICHLHPPGPSCTFAPTRCTHLAHLAHIASSLHILHPASLHI